LRNFKRNFCGSLSIFDIWGLLVVNRIPGLNLARMPKIALSECPLMPLWGIGNRMMPLLKMPGIDARRRFKGKLCGDNILRVSAIKKPPGLPQRFFCN
jgi:hypothetical protein